MKWTLATAEAEITCLNKLLTKINQLDLEQHQRDQLVTGIWDTAKSWIEDEFLEEYRDKSARMKVLIFKNKYDLLRQEGFSREEAITIALRM